MPAKFISHNDQETADYASELSRQLTGGEVLALVGQLGAGKTVFCQAVARALGVKATVASPTFVLMKVYRIRGRKIKNFVHIDAYRLNSGADLAAIGAVDYLGRPDTVVAIEWADKVKNIMPAGVSWWQFKTQKNNRLISRL